VACAQKLAAFAQECTPASQFSNTAAFASLHGLAMLIAIGERIAAQIASRAGVPTVQTLYDRLSEIPNREPAGPKFGSRQEIQRRIQKSRQHLEE
jgi:hypothetical protein